MSPVLVQAEPEFLSEGWRLWERWLVWEEGLFLWVLDCYFLEGMKNLLLIEKWMHWLAQNLNFEG